MNVWFWFLRYIFNMTLFSFDENSFTHKSPEQSTNPVLDAILILNWKLFEIGKYVEIKENVNIYTRASIKSEALNNSRRTENFQSIIIY